MSFSQNLAALGNQPDIIILISDQERATQHFPKDWEKDNLPTMTFLKQHGFSFDRAYCNSCMCSPSRATLFTGLYPAQHQVTQTLTFGGDFSPAEMQLDTSLPNLASMLYNSGYDVQYRGKWHLSKGKLGENSLTSAEVALYGFMGYVPPDAGEDTKPENFGGGYANHDARYVLEGIQYLQRVRALRAQGYHKPYCLILSLVNPHDVLCYPGGYGFGYTEKDYASREIDLPQTVNEQLLKNKKPMAQEQILASANYLLGTLTNEEMQRNYINLYGFMLKRIDTELGYFVRELYAEHEGISRLADSAVVFRIADHGEMGLAHGGMRQKAFVAYEEATRIPMVISNPLLFPQGTAHTNSMKLASLVDLMPTISAITNATPPDGLRGTSLIPIMEDNTAVQDALLFTFDDTKAGATSMPSAVKAANRVRSIRTEEWKYTYYFDSLGAYLKQYEMYNLLEDPTEYTNLAYDSNYESTRNDLAQQLTELERQKLLLRF